MAANLVDLVKITVLNSGTGALKLGSAAPGFRGIEALSVGLEYSYSIQQNSLWEYGHGIYLDGPPRLTRSPFASSSGGVPVNLKAGAQVAFPLLAEDLATASQMQAALDAAGDANAAAADAAFEAAIATSQAAEAVAAAASFTGVWRTQTALDCSANPNYPAATKGYVWTVSVAGRIGGASGVKVDVGDTIVALADNAGGTQAAVGANWNVLEHNLINAQASYATPTFTGISALDIPADTIRVMTMSYSGTLGSGGGTYTEVTVGGAALLAAHPRAVTTSNGGTRYWQLVPSEFGLFPEQLGAIGGTAIDHAVNNQPALQATVDYGIAVGCLTALFKHPYYSAWAPLRTYATTDYHDSQSGIPVVINGKHFSFKSLCGKTYLYRRAPGGGDPNVWANWPLLSGGAGWRGGFFFLVGQLAAPALYSDRSGITLEDMCIMGGIPIGASYGALNLGTGDGWDVTDKLVNTGGDRWVGDVRIIRSWLDGGRGETVYGTAKTDATLYIRDSVFSNSNGQGINPNSCILDATGVYIYNCAFGVEGWGGARGRLQGVINDCVSAGGLQGGRGTAGVFSAFNNPTRVDADTPTLYLDLEIRKSGTFYPGAWTGGRLRAIDGRIAFSQSIYADGLWDTHFEQIEIVTDTVNTAGVDFSGGNGTTSALQGIQDVKIDRLSYSRTKDARTAARLPATPFTWTNSLGPGIVIANAHGELGAPPVYTGTPADYAPAFLKTNFSNIPGYGAALQNIQTTPTLTWRGPVVLATTTGSGVYNFNLPAGSRNQGEQLVILGGGPGTGRINGDPTSGSGLRSNNRSVFVPPNMAVTLQRDSSFWNVVSDAVPYLTFVQTAYDAPDLAAGARDTLNFTVTGVALGDIILGFSLNVDLGGIELAEIYVSAADTVTVKRINPTGAAINWAPATVRINWTKAT